MVGLGVEVAVPLRGGRAKASSVRVDEVEAVGEGGQREATGEREGRRKGEWEWEVEESGAETRKGWLLGVGHDIE